MSLARRISVAMAAVGNALAGRSKQPRVVVTITIRDVPQFIFFGGSHEVPFDG